MTARKQAVELHTRNNSSVLFCSAVTEIIGDFISIDAVQNGGALRLPSCASDSFQVLAEDFTKTTTEVFCSQKSGMLNETLANVDGEYLTCKSKHNSQKNGH